MVTSNITVCIGTYGDPDVWMPLAEQAAASAYAQTVSARDVIRCHTETLHQARNLAARHVDSGWLCFLDADDELAPTYLEAMEDVAGSLSGDWLLQPATLGVHPDGHEDDEPTVIPRKPLINGNFMVIGTLIRAEQFHHIGGFRDWLCYEDWDLWLRAWIDGADMMSVPEAVYRVHVKENSRNNGPRPVQVATYNAIRARHMIAARKRERRG